MKKSAERNPEELLPLQPAMFHILVALAERERHGYGIMQEVAAQTEGKMRISPGTLYGSIKRMIDQGLIHECDERRRYYCITPFGRAVAGAETARLSKLIGHAIASLLPRSGPA